LRARQEQPPRRFCTTTPMCCTRGMAPLLTSQRTLWETSEGRVAGPWINGSPPEPIDSRRHRWLHPQPHDFGGQSLRRPPLFEDLGLRSLRRFSAPAGDRGRVRLRRGHGRFYSGQSGARRRRRTLDRGNPVALRRERNRGDPGDLHIGPGHQSDSVGACAIYRLSVRTLGVGLCEGSPGGLFIKRSMVLSHDRLRCQHYRVRRGAGLGGLDGND
jgi:hypothetical protein